MKFSIERGALLKAVSQAQSVVERRNTIPILANVLIEAEGDRVQFRATDLDIEVVDRVTAMVERAGSTTVSAVMLHEIVRKLRDPALLEYLGSGLIQANVFPIPAGEDREIALSYSQILPDKPLWLTEWGVLDRPDDPAQDIANYATHFISYLKARYPGRIAAMLWYAWAQGMHNGYGLVDRQGNPRPPLTERFLLA